MALGYDVGGMQDAVSKMTSSLNGLQDLFSGNLESAIRDFEETYKSSELTEEALSVYYNISGNFANFSEDLSGLIDYVTTTVIPEYERTESEFNKDLGNV